MTALTTFGDLVRTIDATLDTGKLGVCVAVRVHVQLDDSAADPVAVLAALDALAGRALAAPAVSVAVRCDASGGNWNAIVAHEGGKTAVVTISLTRRPDPGLDLVLIGNRGIARLEGGEGIGTPPATEADALGPWRRAAEESLRSGRTVAIG